MEADAHSYQFSSRTFAKKVLFPEAKSGSYNMEFFVKQAESTPEDVLRNVCWTVKAGAEGSVGVDSKDE